MKQMYEVPILLIIYNRLDFTKETLRSISKINPSKIFIYADGPKDIFDAKKCTLVREFVINSIDWECDIKTKFENLNQGCGRGPSSAITWFFNNVEFGIILEDDCIPDVSFFEFCRINLERYKNHNISIISGSNFDRENLTSNDNYSYFFSKIPFTWGWATWSKNWKSYDYQILDWGNVKKNKLLKYITKDKEQQAYWRKLFDDIYNDPPDDIWDYQFFFKCFINKQLAIVPRVNLIENIGFGEFATHTKFGESVKSQEINFPLTHPDKFNENKIYDNYLLENNYGKIVKQTIISKFKQIIKRTIFGKIILKFSFFIRN